MTPSEISEVAILVPVLRRPQRVKPTIDGFRSTTPAHRLLFLPDPDDLPERQAIAGFGAEQLPVAGNYAQKIRAGVEATDEALVFTAADDLQPHPGWFLTACSHLTGNTEVVGVNDLIMRKRKHATHFLMTREYAERPVVDGGPGPFHAGYHHWFCDDELIATAKRRGAYSYALDAVVEHLHPIAGKAPHDEVYAKGEQNWRRDHQHFRRRTHLWGA